MLKKQFLLLSTIFTCLLLNAQRIKGKLVTGKNEPVKGATVNLLDNSTVKLLKVAATDENGNFELAFQSSGSPVLISISAIGFDSISFEVTRSDLGIMTRTN